MNPLCPIKIIPHSLTGFHYFRVTWLLWDDMNRSCRWVSNHHHDDCWNWKILLAIHYITSIWIHINYRSKPKLELCEGCCAPIVRLPLPCHTSMSHFHAHRTRGVVPRLTCHTSISQITVNCECEASQMNRNILRFNFRHVNIAILNVAHIENIVTGGCAERTRHTFVHHP